jgi:hypothetical protein
MAIVITILAGVFAVLLSNEASAWLPVLSKRLLARAVRKLPEELRARYEEEWEAHALEIPGELSKIINSISMQIVGRRIRRSRSTPAESTIKRAGWMSYIPGGGMKYAPGSSTFGLLPEPERSPISFVISSTVNTAILCAFVLAGMAAKPAVPGVADVTPQSGATHPATVSAPPNHTANAILVDGQPLPSEGIPATTPGAP